MHTMKTPDTYSVHQWRRYVRDSGALANTTGAAVKLLFVIGLWAKEGTGEFRLSYPAAMRQTGISERSAKYAMKELQTLGLIEQVSRGGGGKPSVWRVTTPDEDPR